MARQELASFLRDRREALRPADVGLPPGSRRRTPGLRREEVAGLANMSAEYYGRLEQARGPQPSAPILDGVADALRLTTAERAHVFRLAGVAPPPPPGPPRRVRPYVAGLLERMPDTAAIVTTAAYDVVAWNPIAEALLGDLRARPNLARRRFLRREEVLTTGHEDFAEIAVARLRAAADRYPRDHGLSALLTELHAGSEEFTQIWDTHPVRTPGHRTKIMSHPQAGPLGVHCDVLAIPEDDQQVVFITADPGSPSARALRRLAAVEPPSVRLKKSFVPNGGCVTSPAAREASLVSLVGFGCYMTSSIALASKRCPAGEGCLLQVPSGSLISSPAAHGEPPKAADGPSKAAKPLATFPPNFSVTDAITELSASVAATLTGSL
jgi:transcriptional regulator with XRE-family HTH domain